MTRQPLHIRAGRRSRGRRGVALLLVLVALVLGLTAATIAAQVAVTASLTKRLDRAQEIADDAASSTLPRIERWLVGEAGQAVAPIETTVPAIGVIDETVSVDAATSMHVRVTAYDQRGMVPWTQVRSLGSLASLLPSDVRGSVAAVALTQETVPGLDLVSAVDEHGQASRPVWPGHAPVTDPHAIRHYGDPASDGGSVAGSNDDDGQPALGGLVATHCPGRPAINVNTAPRELVQAIERLTQRSVWSVVEERRAAGKPAAIGGITGGVRDMDGMHGATSGPDDDSMPTFVASSDVWSFRVDVTYAGVRSSWWVTYARSDRGWILRQRLRVLA